MTQAELEQRLPARLARWAPQLLAAELCFGVDPFLMAALLDRESRGGEALTPPMASGTGDGGHGRGLAQIDDRFHASFIAATDDADRSLWKDPAFNVLYGARLLARGLNAGEDVAVAAYNAGLQRAIKTVRALPSGADSVARRAALDGITTGKDYVSDVLCRRDAFLAAPPRTA